MLTAIARYFPAGTRVSHPEGGYFLWVELPPGSPDVMELLRRCLHDNTCFMPGPVFSPTGGFGSHLRLNYGHAWSAAMEHAVQLMGAHAAAGPRLAAPLASEAVG